MTLPLPLQPSIPPVAVPAPLMAGAALPDPATWAGTSPLAPYPPDEFKKKDDGQQNQQSPVDVPSVLHRSAEELARPRF